MAGKPVRAKRLALLDELGEEEVFRLYVQHRSVTKLCKAIFEPTDPNAERWGNVDFYQWIKATPERKAWWQECQVVRGEIHVELAVDAAVEATNENVQLQRLKFDANKWAAGIFNREYRPGQSNVNVNVGVSVGQGWLDAMKEIAARETIQAEVVEDE